MHLRFNKVMRLGICLLLSSATLASAQVPLADRVVGSIGRSDLGLFVYSGISQSYLQWIVSMLARAARVPIGFEEAAQPPAPFEENLADIRAEDRTVLLGLTVGRALDAVVAADPRYAWREQDGVLLLRPVTAWRDGSHFLLQRGRPIEVGPTRALDIVRDIYQSHGLRVMSSGGGLTGDEAGRREDLSKPLSITLPGVSLLEQLNAIVKAHGELGWMVRYPSGSPALRNSCIKLMTFDGWLGEVGAVSCAPKEGR